MRYTPLATIAFGSLLLLGAPASAQTNNSYSAPTEFMQLFFDFTDEISQEWLIRFLEHRMARTISPIVCNCFFG